MTGDSSDKQRALQDIRTDIETTRERLARTLDEIEERLDVRKRAIDVWEESRDQALALVREGRNRFDALRQENPAIVYGALGGVAAVVLGAGLLVARSARR